MVVSPTSPNSPTIRSSELIRNVRGKRSRTELATHQTAGRQSDHATALPWELIELIAVFLFGTRHPAQSATPQAETICCKKPDWDQVSGFMAASPQTHRTGFRLWLSVLTIREKSDWTMALEFFQAIRELICEDGVFASDRDVLARFPHLYAVSIQSHQDVHCDAATNQFSYRKIFTSLPASLRRLEIRHAHGPDISVISTVKKRCPALEELILGRCSMFNQTPACQFWRNFPFDHNSYISNEGTDAYTRSLGSELAALDKLARLRLGVYFAPSDIVLAHRAFHSQGIATPALVDWQQVVPPALQQAADGPPHPDEPRVQALVSLLHNQQEDDFSPNSCQFCREQSFDATRSAEKSASDILKELVPSLVQVEWMDWFTARHLGVSTYLYAPLGYTQ